MPAVTVALLGDPAHPGHSIPEEEWERPWDDRQRRELQVELTENLGSIRERAREQFGVPMPDHAPDGPIGRAFPFVAFYSESRPGQRSMPSMSLTIADDRGRAVWNVDPDLVQFEQLLRSAELGVLDGDPHRIYLILLPPSGNGIFVDWQALLDAWRICWDVLDSIDTLAGAAAAAEYVRRKIRDRLARGRAVLEQQAPSWSQRNGSPHDVASLIERRSWTPDEAARLLGINEEDAPAALEIFGFAQDVEDGRWYRSGDQAAALLHDLLQEIWQYPPTENAPMFRTRVDELLRTGETMPYPDYRDRSQLPEDGQGAAAWDPERDSRVIAVVLLSVVMLAALLVGLLIEGGILTRLGAAAIALLAALLFVRARLFRDLAQWLARRL
jgi:hypothetical protein